MWNRACPLCFTKMPRAVVLSKSEELACPSCHAPLELSRPSRVLDAAVGLAAGFAAVSAIAALRLPGAWALELAAAVLAYGAASATLLAGLADLTVRPKEAALPQTHK